MSRSRLRVPPVLALVGAVIALCSVCLPAAFAAAPPAGPRLVFFEAEFILQKEGSERAGFVTADPRGHDLRPLATPPSVAYGGLRFSWSADGAEYAFVGRPPKPGKKGATSKRIAESVSRSWVARADGTGAHPVAGTDGTTASVLSPDGRWIAFTRTHEHHPKIDPKNPQTIIESLTHGYESRSTWIVPTAGGKVRRLTPWRNLLFSEPDSFSPDGATLLVTVYRPGSKTEVDAIDLATGKQRTIEVEASEASYSPDGSQIAFISYRDHESVSGFDEREGTSEIYVAAADGTGARRITHTPKLEENAPNWDPSGARLAYLSSPGGMLGLLKGSVAESNPDGSCRTVLPRPHPRRKHGEMVVGEPSWVPGPERGAGPLSC